MNFIKVKEKEYNETIFLNLDNITNINEKAGIVCTNGIETSLDGSIEPRIYKFDKENMQKIMEVIRKNGNIYD